MTTRWTRRVLHTDSRSGALALVAAIALMASLTVSFFSSSASAAAVAPLGRTDNVAICHHDNGKPVYNYISPNVDSIITHNNGHDTHADDIIPPFTYDIGGGVQHYPGKGDQAVLANQCNAVPPLTQVAAGSLGPVPSVCSNGAATLPGYTVPSTAGVVYTPSVGGTGAPGSTVTVAAAAASGYVLTGPSTISIVLGPLATACGGGLISVVAGSLGPVPSVCSNGAATLPGYTVPSTTGVVYTPAVGGTGAPGSTVTVAAAAASGYVLTGPSTISIVLGQLATGCVPGNPGNPGNPGTPVITTPNPGQAAEDLGIVKTGPASVHPGDVVGYTLDVTNLTGTPATSFTVTDVLPAPVLFTSATGPGFSCLQTTRGTVVCGYAGSLAVGQTVRIVVQGVLTTTFDGAQITNTSSLSGRSDNNPANDFSSATTDVVPNAAPAVVTPVTGGGGGQASGPVTTPVKGGGGGTAQTPTLPFTGSRTAQELQTGLALFLLGWFLITAGRRRPAHAE